MIAHLVCVGIPQAGNEKPEQVQHGAPDCLADGQLVIEQVQNRRAQQRQELRGRACRPCQRPSWLAQSTSAP